MRAASFDLSRALSRWDELMPPSGIVPAADLPARALSTLADAVGAAGGVLLAPDGNGGGTRRVAGCGAVPDGDPTALYSDAVRADHLREIGGRAGAPARVLVPLHDGHGAAAALVLERPARWGDAARDFTRFAARAIALALTVERLRDDMRHQGDVLARRSVELEALGELAARLHGLEREDDLLHAALDLVLEKLGLSAGWIFWGHASRGRLELAACRGVSDAFVERSRASGIGTCLCQDVFATGKLAVARNTTECPRLPELVAGEGASTHACIPLKFERGVLGVLNVAHRAGRSFSPEELRFLEIVGSQLCLAVDKTRTGRAEAQRNAEARALTDLARSVGGSLDLDRVLAAIGEYARALLAADRCALFLGDGTGPFTFAYLSGPPLAGLQPGRPIDVRELESRAFPEAIRRGRPLAVANAATDPASNAELARRWNVGSAILVPLLSRDRLEGILHASRATPSTWTHEQTELAEALGRQAAVAIENARLYREAREAVLKLQQAQFDMMKAERMAAVGMLASSLAHEVRNPLNSISLQLVLLSRRVARAAAGADPEMATLVETARREIDRLDALVGEFLTLSSVDRVRLREHDVQGIVREVIDLLLPVAAQKGVALAEGAGQALPPLLLDQEKIKQVLINLVRNAIEATAEGGFVTITCRRDGGRAVVEVSDTGVGIEPGLDVFDFFITTKRGGTGLGLPIARRIVEAHGGRLTFESQPGIGTTFSVTFKIPGSGHPPDKTEAAR